MGHYLFHNENVYFSNDGKTGRVPLEEFAASSLVRDRSVHILIVEPDGPAFFGHIRRVRALFANKAIKTCVPYALALRALLSGKGLLMPGQALAMVDDIGDRFIITAFKGDKGLITRVIFAQSPEKVVEEVRRTQKSLPEKTGPIADKGLMRIVSNNAAVIDALDEAVKESAVYFEETLPVFEVLGKVKFPVHLVSPEEALAQKRGAFHRITVLICMAAVLVALAGIGCRVYAKGQDDLMIQRLGMLLSEERVLEQKLSGLAAGTCSARLKALPQVDFAEAFDRFLKKLPPQALVEDAAFERRADMHWNFLVRIAYPRQDIFPWEGRDEFGPVKLEHILIQGRPGMRLGFQVPDDAAQGRALP